MLLTIVVGCPFSSVMFSSRPWRRTPTYSHCSQGPGVSSMWLSLSRFGMADRERATAPTHSGDGSSSSLRASDAWSEPSTMWSFSLMLRKHSFPHRGAEGSRSINNF